MGRPKHPLISRKKTLEVALRIIDDEGLDALSIRKLGDKLEVRGISLYHHFKNKEEILIGACELALDKIRTPRSADGDWRVWLAQNSIEYWRALRAHPNLIPILMRRHPLRIGLVEHNATAGLLAVQGVPPGAIMALLEGTEALALGCAAYESSIMNDNGSDDWPSLYPFLYHVGKNREISREASFETMVKGIIDAIVEQYSKVSDVNIVA